jgi:hypothetical protein
MSDVREVVEFRDRLRAAVVATREEAEAWSEACELAEESCGNAVVRLQADLRRAPNADGSKLEGTLRRAWPHVRRAAAADTAPAARGHLSAAVEAMEEPWPIAEPSAPPPA